MREIKFRAWDKENSCWFDDNWNLSIQPDGIVFGRFDNDDWVQLDESLFVLMQYTGLKDKNGAEIYEGDIVKRAESEWQGYEYNIIVGYKQSFYNNVCDLERFIERGDQYEVIGNIYENPEKENT